MANGLVIGSTYAVVAIGFALAFTVLRVINFAHPDIFMVGMFAGLLPAAQWPALGLGVAVLAGAAGGEGFRAALRADSGCGKTWLLGTLANDLA